jgi:hypothetical protein
MRFEFRLETVAARMGATVLSMKWELDGCVIKNGTIEKVN